MKCPCLALGPRLFGYSQTSVTGFLREDSTQECLPPSPELSLTPRPAAHSPTPPKVPLGLPIAGRLRFPSVFLGSTHRSWLPLCWVAGVALTSGWVLTSGQIAVDGFLGHAV